MGVGASRIQMVLHHCLPLTMPGMLTDSIVGMALGQERPAADDRHSCVHRGHPPGGTDPATVLPVQIYLWAHSPERAFVEKARKRAMQDRAIAHPGRAGRGSTVERTVTT